MNAGKLVVLALVVMVVAVALVVPVVAGAVARVGVMVPPRLSVRAGIRAVALRLPPCVRVGMRVVEGRSRSGRCRARMPFARAGPPAAADPASPTPRGRGMGITLVPSAGFMWVGRWLKTGRTQGRARS